MRKFFELVRVHLQGIFVQFPSPAWFRILVHEFDALQGISYIIGGINRSHISIFVLTIGLEDYYNRMSFYSISLQDIVHTKFVFKNYKFGWAKSTQDWTLFQLIKVGRYYTKCN